MIWRAKKRRKELIALVGVGLTGLSVPTCALATEKYYECALLLVRRVESAGPIEQASAALTAEERSFVALVARLVDSGAFTGEALNELLLSDEPLNPMSLRLVHVAPEEQYVYTRAFENALRSKNGPLNWQLVRQSLSDLLLMAEARRVMRENASSDTRPVIATAKLLRYPINPAHGDRIYERATQSNAGKAYVVMKFRSTELQPVYIYDVAAAKMVHFAELVDTDSLSRPYTAFDGRSYIAETSGSGVRVFSLESGEVVETLSVAAMPELKPLFKKTVALQFVTRPDTDVATFLTEDSNHALKVVVANESGEAFIFDVASRKLAPAFELPQNFRLVLGADGRTVFARGFQPSERGSRFHLKRLVDRTFEEVTAFDLVGLSWYAVGGKGKMGLHQTANGNICVALRDGPHTYLSDVSLGPSRVRSMKLPDESASFIGSDFIEDETGKVWFLERVEYLANRLVLRLRHVSDPTLDYDVPFSADLHGGYAGLIKASDGRKFLFSVPEVGRYVLVDLTNGHQFPLTLDANIGLVKGEYLMPGDWISLLFSSASSIEVFQFYGPIKAGGAK